MSYKLKWKGVTVDIDVRVGNFNNSVHNSYPTCISCSSARQTRNRLHLMSFSNSCFGFFPTSPHPPPQRNPSSWYIIEFSSTSRRYFCSLRGRRRKGWREGREEVREEFPFPFCSPSQAWNMLRITSKFLEIIQKARTTRILQDFLR